MYCTKNKLTVVIILLITCVSAVAHDLKQPTQLNNPITDPIYALFDGMREHEQDKILAQFTQQALLQRISTEGKIVNTDLRQFAQSVSKNTAKLDEHLLAVTVHQTAELASVWTPFAFYLNDQLSHCGSNSFQMVKIKNEWKINYLIDVTYKGDCAEFVAKHTG
jgi:hypothetical protein